MAALDRTLTVNHLGWALVISVLSLKAFTLLSTTFVLVGGFVGDFLRQGKTVALFHSARHKPGVLTSGLSFSLVSLSFSFLSVFLLFSLLGCFPAGTVRTPV